MASIDQVKLSAGEIDSVLRQPNGPYTLMELVRMGRVDSTMAIEALNRGNTEPLYKRILLALVETVLPSKDSLNR